MNVYNSPEQIMCFIWNVLQERILKNKDQTLHITNIIQGSAELGTLQVMLYINNTNNYLIFQIIHNQNPRGMGRNIALI